jgi:hypothetical protein
MSAVGYIRIDTQARYHRYREAGSFPHFHEYLSPCKVTVVSPTGKVSPDWWFEVNINSLVAASGAVKSPASQDPARYLL